VDVQLPDGKVLRGVPDGTTKAQLVQKLQANGMQVPQEWMSSAPTQAEPPVQKPPAPQQPNTWGQAVKNVGQGIAHAGTSFTGNLAGNIAGLGALGVNAMFPTRAGSPALDPAAIRDRVSAASTYTPENPNSLTMRVVQAPGKVVSGAGEFLRSGADKLDPSGTLGHVAAAVPQAAADFIGIKGTQLATAPKVPTPYKAPVKEVPTTEQLRTAVAESYKAAEDAGVVIKPESTRRVVTMMKSVAAKENLGKLPTKLKEAADVLTERIESKQPLTLMDADKVRQLIGDAFKSTDAADRRLAKIIQGKYDQYMDQIGPGDVVTGDAKTAVAVLKDARTLYKRMSNSAMLDAMEKKAATKGEANYTQAGKEHGLRKQFEQFSGNDKKMGRLNAEQQEAMRRVAAPGIGANAVRNLGKFDPLKGGLSTLPALIAAAVEPVSGLGLAIAGNTANRLALRSTTQNVSRAREALVGRGLTGTARPAPAAQGTKAGKGKDARQSKARNASAVGFEQREARR
jgi:hypothetical protein